MQLIMILLATVSVLTILSGTTVFFGAKKGDRIKSFWFFVATFFATAWTVSICLFLTAPIGSPEKSISWHANWTYISAIYIDIALLAYISWKDKSGRILTLFFLIFGCILTTIFFSNPELLYTKVILNSSGNSLVQNIGVFYFIYIGFFCLLIPTVIFALVRQIIKSNSSKKRHGDLVLLAGFIISGTMSLIFDLILPFWRWDLVWVGPLAISTTIVAFYYSILRYRVLNISSIWLRTLSYIVIIASLAVIYMVIFSIVFAAMFKGSAPSVEVIVLNFVMISIVLLLMPVTNELNMFVRSLIPNRSIDMTYIIKKITQFPRKKIDLKELAYFLAEHLHFEYIGIVIDNQVYGTKAREIQIEEIREVSRISNNAQGIYLLTNDKNDKYPKALSAIAALKDDNGTAYGHILFGKPQSKNGLSKRDIAQIDTIINLLSVVIEARLI